MSEKMILGWHNLQGFEDGLTTFIHVSRMRISQKMIYVRLFFLRISNQVCIMSSTSTEVTKIQIHQGG